MNAGLWLAAITGSILVPAAVDRTSDELKALPACAPIRAQTHEGWSETPVRERFSVSLPPSCRHDSEPRFVHGGDRWQCGSTTVEVVWGMWGKGSFSESSAKCAVEIAGLRVMVVREQRDHGPGLEVWYPIGEIHEPLVSAWSSRPEDLPVLEAVVLSGRVKAAR